MRQLLLEACSLCWDNLSAEAVSQKKKMIFSGALNSGGPSPPMSFPAAGCLLPPHTSLAALGQSDS